MTDYYELLQVRDNASPEVIEAAYRRLARMYHPDVNNGPDDPALVPFASLIAMIMKDHMDGKVDPVAKRLVDDLKDGQGEAYLLDPTIPMRNTRPVDLKNALKLAMNPCRIDI